MDEHYQEHVPVEQAASLTSSGSPLSELPIEDDMHAVAVETHAPIAAPKRSPKTFLATHKKSLALGSLLLLLLASTTVLALRSSNQSSQIAKLQRNNKEGKEKITTLSAQLTAQEALTRANETLATDCKEAMQEVGTALVSALQMYDAVSEAMTYSLRGNYIAAAASLGEARGAENSIAQDDVLAAIRRCGIAGIPA